ncbi:MAG: globin [Nocardioidaceae bacterium]
MTTTGEQTFYDAIGGHDTVRGIVETFYAGVAEDPELRAMYPEETLDGATDRLTMFLEQYWGGPTTYSQRRGHPRLGQRHAPFAVTPQARDRWLGHMQAALAEAHLTAEQRQTFWDYLVRAAHFLVNTPEE